MFYSHVSYITIKEEHTIGMENMDDLSKGETHRAITDDTLPRVPVGRSIVYKAPFAKCGGKELEDEIATR